MGKRFGQGDNMPIRKIGTYVCYVFSITIVSIALCVDFVGLPLAFIFGNHNDEIGSCYTTRINGFMTSRRTLLKSDKVKSVLPSKDLIKQDH